MKPIYPFTIILLASLLAPFTFGQIVTIPIATENTATVLQTDQNRRLKIIYTGKSLSSLSEYERAGEVVNLRSEGASSNNNAYAVAGIDNNFVEPAIAVVHADGNNSLDLLYETHEVSQTPDGATLTKVVLKDPVYPFHVDLFYRAWKEKDVVEQWSAIRHDEEGEVVLHKYASANLYLFNKEYLLTSYNGAWAREMQPVETPLRQGMHTIESRLGTREHLLTSPNFTLALDGQATETTGTVMMGQLAWNGNFALQFETDVYKNLHIVAGINPYQSSYHLKPNVAFETPPFVYTLSFEGKGRASRNLHAWLRDHTLLDGHGERLTLLNNWEATYFGFNQERLVSLFEGAKELGVDMFLLDDGWFANKYPRNRDNAGLGDWQVNRAKLPDGVPFLVREAEKQGIKFGIWIEPEMVNPKSELYEQHPDWVIKQEQRPEIYFRNQLVLDLANPEVQDFVFGVVDDLLTENPTLAFMKWDCNAPVFNGHSNYLERENIPQSHLYVEYSRGLQNVLKRIREKYPKVPMMLCSGGGGRSDYNLLRYFTEFWLSDNTDPLERVFMQWDYSHYYPAIAMCNHVTNWSDKPLKYRIDVASMGKLGFDIRTYELSERDMTLARQAVHNYHEYKDLVWHGEMYRLASPYEHDLASLMYVNEAKTEGVIFNYLTNWRYLAEPSLRPVKLQGLDGDKLYRLTEINLYEGTNTSINGQKTYSGEFLMNVGFNPLVSSYRSSVVVRVEAVF
ncbi:MAG: alpha-galactosidase [Bacteroidota bacterium]|jgi:alpha-galactosidase|nr:alpha-galactosidase [Bacteroidota bacterium]HHU97625.1 alpha-galactosidase [Petrimonas sp.]